MALFKFGRVSEAPLIGVDLRRLRGSWCHREVAIKDLPRAEVKRPFEYLDRAAVLSWRWDLDAEGHSTNVWLAIQYARAANLRFLFFDHVSINQSVARSALLKQVLSFSALYRRLPVIAAYDHVETRPGKWWLTMQRPWIKHEARQYAANPYSVTYASFLTGQGLERNTSTVGVVTTDFCHQARAVAGAGYTDTIVRVLLGQAHMTSEDDFALILPEFAEALSAAHATMSRNDYLLATAVLVALDERALLRPDGFRIDGDITQKKFSRFSIAEVAKSESETDHSLRLDGVNIGMLKGRNLTFKGRHYFEPNDDCHDVILRAVGMSAKEIESWRSAASARQESLLVAHVTPGPVMREWRLDLTAKRWWKIN